MKINNRTFRLTEMPVELVFYNPRTKHYSVFETRLIFSETWHADLFTQTKPPPPSGFQWMKIEFQKASQVTKDERCIPFQELIDELRNAFPGEVKEQKYEILLGKDGKLYQPFRENDIYINKGIAQRLSGCIPVPNGYEPIVVAVTGEKYPNPPEMLEK